MEARQLYAGGEPIVPESSAAETSADDTHGLAGGGETTVQRLLDELADRVAHRLLEKAAVAAWALRETKPEYTAGEVGADAAGSARDALAAAREYADATYMQATGYTDMQVAALVNGAPETMDTLKEIADAMAENEDVVEALQAAIGSRASDAEVQAHNANTALHVTQSKQDKWDGYAARIDEVFQSAGNGKALVAAAITGRGVTTAADAEFQTMADNIASITLPSGNATAGQVLAGRTFSNASGAGLTGTMANRGAVTSSLNAGGSYTIPAGYHNGKGKVSAAALSGQTDATAVAANLTKGKTAWVKGAKITGTGADCTAQYNAGVTAADARVNTNSANYKAGYSAGVTAADARTNVNSANYKAGYSAGAAAARLKETALSLSVLSGNGGTIVTSGDINFAGALFLKICYGYTSANREACVAKVYRGGTVYRQQYIPKGYSAGSALATAGLTAIIDVSGIGGVANFQLFPDNANSGRNDAGTYNIQSVSLYTM